MLNLNEVRIVLFDFDETLCVHQKHTTGRDRIEYLTDILRNGADDYKEKDANLQLKKFIEVCFSNGIEIGIISACNSFITMEAKCKWADERYGIKFVNYCVDSAESKIDMMIAISRFKELQRSEIAIVDDLIFILTNAANAGFTAWTPMEIVNFINQLERVS